MCCTQPSRTAQRRGSTYARIEVALAAIAALAGAAWLWTGTLRFAAPRLALAGIALLAVFAVWNGLTVLWSVSPDQTWVEFNRALSYVLVLCLAVALGTTDTSRAGLDLVRLCRHRRLS